MALVRYDPATTLDYFEDAFPYNNTVTVADFTGNEPATIEAGDELFCQVALRVRYNNVGAGTVDVDPPWGLSTPDAASPLDTTIGAGVTTRSSVMLFRRVADGTAADNCEVSVTSTGYTSGTSEVYASCIFWLYRGGELTPYSDGSLAGGDTSGSTPTDAATTTVPNDTLAISGAYQRLNTVPSLHTTNGFGLFHGDDPNPSDVDPPAIAVADRQIPVGATISLPRWLVERGSSTGEHHNYWVAYTVVPPLQRVGFRYNLRFGLQQGGF